MLTLPPSVRVFLCLAPADMRRSLDGLAALTREILREDPLSGHLFVYFNRRREAPPTFCAPALRIMWISFLQFSQYSAGWPPSIMVYRSNEVTDDFRPSLQRSSQS